MRITPCEGWPRRSAHTSTSAVTAACSSASPALRKISAREGAQRIGPDEDAVGHAGAFSVTDLADRVAARELRRAELDVPFLVGVLDEAVVLLAAPPARAAPPAARRSVSRQRLTLGYSSISTPWNDRHPQPRIHRHVGDGVFAGGEPFAVGEMQVHHVVEPVGLPHVARRCRPRACRARNDPGRTCRTRAPARASGRRSTSGTSAIAWCRAASSARSERSARPSPRDRTGSRPDSNSEISFPPGPSRSIIAGVLLLGLILRNAGLELLALADHDRVRLVGQTALLEHDMDLVAVRGRPSVEIDHRRLID